MSNPISPQALAQACCAAMLEHDHATRFMGIEIEAVGPGTCTARMAVVKNMLNGHAICHGGFITTLADSAFAFACNAYNEVSVASGFDVNLMAPAREGDVLTATAQEIAKSGRTGVYDIAVHNQRGMQVAAFRGRSYSMKGRPVLPNRPDLPVGKPA